MYQKNEGKFLKHLDFLILDLIIVETTYIVSYFIRHGFKCGGMSSAYWQMAGIMALIQIIVVAFQESYKDIVKRGYLEEMKAVFFQHTIMMLLVFAFMFVTKLQEQYSRAVFLHLWGIGLAVLYLEHIIWKNILRKRIKESDERACLLIISEKNVLEEDLLKLQRDYEAYRVTGIICYDENLKGREINGIPVVGNTEEIFEYAKSNVLDEVFLHISEENEYQKKIIERFLDMGIVVHVNLSWKQEELPNHIVEKLGEASVLTTSVKTASIYQVTMKRLIDIIGGVVGVIFTAVLCVVLAPIIYIQSPGPIFFSQWRVGKNGRRFKIYKFRSMYTDAEERKKELMSQNKMNGLMFKMDEDPRIFPAGHIIRKFSLDEFPQFWNVLKGDMSLVGTRPPTVDEFEQYEEHHRIRLSIKPGITGLWQVSGRSDITDFEEVVQLDNQYIVNWSLKLDIKIMLKTIGVVLGAKGSV